MTAHQIEMLDALLDLESGLTPWELNFLESMDGQREQRLSEKQGDTLQRIFGQRVEGSDA